MDAARRSLVGLVEREGAVAVGDAVACLAPPGRAGRPALAAPALATRVLAVSE